MEWEVVIGLEIHAQLATQSKIFSGAATRYGEEPNTQACAVDLGLPGVLPVLNEQAVMMAIKFGLAIDADISRHAVFARKNYFYPDLPKGYQISQFDQPIVGKGALSIPLADDKEKTIGITRAHLEEDAGKSMHQDFQNQTGIDLNRAGTPLLEIVSEPDMRSAQEAVAYMKKIHSLVRYLEICDGNMQEGSFRCDANVSIRPLGQAEFGTRTELKNINSFRHVEKAINIEIERQIDVVESGQTVIQETRLYDADNNETRSMRSKEEANDYRYFPDPDLLPVIIDDDTIARIRSSLPELPDEKCRRYQQTLQLSAYDAQVITSNKDMAEFYEQLLMHTDNQDPKLCANWVIGPLAGALNKADITIEHSPITSAQLAGVLVRISDNTLSGKIAKQVFDSLWLGEGKDADSIIAEKGLKQMTDSNEIAALVDTVIAQNTQQVEQYRNGKEQIFGFFVGQVMKASKGKANPAQVNALLKAKLG
ncbi:MAG TPA: Asp-tRNA(Asn)/Glu-tRNA(Gln) amidotransferase GatCAB subunit B [Gammaproteobacteria bacterium]|nr:Asp-tRNA(Asn)/Glu-tRNA(Gln) amidotransferase GatCAB subunit B [Gammaproteobacteria bacterium]